jgi:hypothetical protein
MHDDERQKDKILQTINDILEEHDWGGRHKKLVVKISFKGRLWMLDPEIIIKDSLDEKTRSDMI